MNIKCSETCTVDNDIEDYDLSKVTLISKKKSNTDIIHCNKCKGDSVVVLAPNHSLCKSCFIMYCHHKFSSVVGKEKLIKPGDKVLLACSTGMNSTAMFHLTKQTQEMATHKKLKFHPGVLIINENYEDENFQRNREIKNHPSILKNLAISSYPVFYSSLEMIFHIRSKESFYWNSQNFQSQRSISSDVRSRYKTKLRQCLKHMTLTDKRDFMKYLKLHLITEIAYQEGYHYVFVEDSTTSLAIEFLLNITTGRGSQASLNNKFCDKRFKVPICRPLREFTSKELALYNYFHNYSYTVEPNLFKKLDALSNIYYLIETLLLNLEVNFSATFYTVFRTATKIFESKCIQETSNCYFCKSRLFRLDSPMNALEPFKIAIELLHSKSNQNQSSHDDVQNTSEETKGDFEDKIKADQNAKVLCERCSIILNCVDEDWSFLPQKEN